MWSDPEYSWIKNNLLDFNFLWPGLIFRLVWHLSNIFIPYQNLSKCVIVQNISIFIFIPNVVQAQSLTRLKHKIISLHIAYASRKYYTTLIESFLKHVCIVAYSNFEHTIKAGAKRIKHEQHMTLKWSNIPLLHFVVSFQLRASIVCKNSYTWYQWLANYYWIASCESTVRM